MNEPRRLHEEPGSELEHSLLSVGRSYTASASSRAGTLAALGLVGAAASSTTAAAAMTKTSAVKWLAATALVVGVAFPLVHYLLTQSPPAEHGLSAATHSVPAPGAGALAPDTAATIPEPALTGTQTASPQAATIEQVPSTSGVRPTTSNAPGLAAELAALDAARSALAAGDPAGALANLDAYGRAFPRGKLAPEAEVLRIEALAKNGQTGLAQKRAQTFIKRHPASVLAARVRAYLAQ